MQTLHISIFIIVYVYILHIVNIVMLHCVFYTPWNIDFGPKVLT